MKIMKITSNSIHNRQKRQKAQNDKNNNFLNELVENADIRKPVFNKIKATNEQCVKYDFVAPLISTAMWKNLFRKFGIQEK